MVHTLFLMDLIQIILRAPYLSKVQVLATVSLYYNQFQSCPFPAGSWYRGFELLKSCLVSWELVKE